MNAVIEWARHLLPRLECSKRISWAARESAGMRVQMINTGGFWAGTAFSEKKTKSSITFNTLACSETLQRTGMPREHVERVARANREYVE